MNSIVKKILFTVVGIITVSGAVLFLAPRAESSSCPAEVLKFFPHDQISFVIGKITGTSDESFGGCNFSIESPPGGLASARVYEYSSTAAAKLDFEIRFAGGESLNIGDSSSFRANSGYGAVLKGKYIFSVNWYCFCTQMIYMSSVQAEKLLSYAASQVPNDPPPETSPPPPSPNPGPVVPPAPEPPVVINCSERTTKYFPPQKLEAVIKKNINSADTVQSSANSESCRFRFEGIFRTYSYEDVDAERASAYFLARAAGSTRSLNVGDESGLSHGGAVARKGNYLFEVSRGQGVFEYLTDEQVYELLKYAVEQIEDEEPPPVLPPKVNNISPDSASAGVKSALAWESGNVYYFDNSFELLIEGENLSHTSFRFAQDGGYDGRQAISVSDINANPDGKQLTGRVTISPNAKEGQQGIIVYNESGNHVVAFEITITGDQYLYRKFKGTNVSFRGEWPEPAPNQHVQELEEYVRSGLQAVNTSAYRNLGLDLRIYAKNYWQEYAEKQNCGTQNVSRGCTGVWGGVIHISEGYGATDQTILHEAAHKLHYHYLVRYPVQFFRKNFIEEWDILVGDQKNCSYLPIVVTANGYKWKDGSGGPRCGFAQPYGSSTYQSPYPRRHAEDVATMTVAVYFGREIRSQGDWAWDRTYFAKEGLLKTYGFIK